MIQLEGVSRRFGRGRGVEAVSDVSLRVTPGEICGIAGPNGAGKSTLLALALGFLRPTRGSVLLFGLSPRDYLRGAPAGYVPERLRFPERWRVAPLLHALAAARSRKQARERAEGVLGLLGLQSESERRVGELSRGTLQRVGIAQALLDEPAVLILDEPTEGLDPLWRLRLRGILAEQRARGAAVLLASHDLAELERSVDRVVVLERGAITRELTARAPGGGGRYRIRARSGGEHLGAAFPNPQSTGDDEYEVEVTDANELSARLAAWLAQGAVLESVRPAGLEEQLRGSFGAER